jgi:uncharacterized protein
VNATSDAHTTAPTPSAAATVQTARPLTTPNEVASAGRRPCTSAFLVTSAVSGPGARITSAATPMNAETFACTVSAWSRGTGGHTIMDVHVQPFDTPRGRANAFVHAAPDARGALILGHGAGGSVTSRDLLTVRDGALAARVSVVLVEQPYRVAGRRAPPPAAQIDEAWISVVEQLRAGELRELSILVGGRSSGARVACRTAQATGAVGVLCLAFPLQPPRRASASSAPASRLFELASVHVPMLVVQGARDPFGVPLAAPGREVVEVAGDHRLSSDLPAVAAAVGAWLERVLEPF